MEEFKRYKRKGFSEMRPYVLGEDLTNISVSDADDPPNDMGMVARNPSNHKDQWYVARKYFKDNLELDAGITDERARKFVRHIAGHLGGGVHVICKICGKTIDEICAER